MLSKKFYLTNAAVISGVILSIIVMFVVQFKVEALQSEILTTENEIAIYQDQIQLLEVEWVYLTRPARLRALSDNYLQNNGYAMASQIKDIDELKKYYSASYQDSVTANLALNTGSNEVRSISF